MNKKETGLILIIITLIGGALYIIGASNKSDIEKCMQTHSREVCEHSINR